MQQKTDRHREGFQKRFEIIEPQIRSYYESIYGDKGFEKLLSTVRTSFSGRAEQMLELDEQRLACPTWYQDPTMVGMMMYVNNFSETFATMPSHIDYLKSLGVTYLHLMPVFDMPESENDGGYAVSDFTKIDPRFGTDEEFNIFAEACHRNGISICIDFVLNHTSDEHEWALKAKEGDKNAQEKFFIFPDRSMPDEYENHVNEVFPVLAPGNFTYSTDLSSWILTTFHHYQWDLNYTNPEVLREMVAAMLQMCNRGVDIFRFDAVPYIWKEWGTSSRNLPQVHTIIRIFRLILELAAPATIIKGEVVMAPHQVAPYFGTNDAPECHLLYNVTMMVELWNSLATRDTRMLSQLIETIPDNIPDSACWVNYVRCHDDIGWGFNEENARSLGKDPFFHKRFLISFYLGAFPGSFARGELYESNPRTLDARNCGTTASLCGLEKAIEERDEYQGELAIKRIILLQVFAFVANGIPVLYSGDELGQLNDYSYTQDPNKARDSRFIHRGRFDWKAADSINDLTRYSSQIFYRLNRYIRAAKGHSMMGNNNILKSIYTSDPAVVCMLVIPRHPEDENQLMVVLANFSEHQKNMSLKEHDYSAVKTQLWSELLQGKQVRLNDEMIIGPYEILLLTPR